MGIPENLERLRKREGLSQTGLAKKANVSQQLISQLERGENLTTKKLPQIARALNASIEEVDPNYAADDLLRGDLLKLFDRLPADLRPVALSRIEALVPAAPEPPAEARPPKAARARR
jgi:transcriptional regulator with XRE-family HTH domain